MPSCNFSLLPCCQEEADTSLSSAPLLFPASWRGVRPQGKEAKKQTKPQHNRTKAHQNQELSFALPEPKEAGPHLSVAAPVAHRRGMRPLRRAAQSWEDEPRHRDPPPHHSAPGFSACCGGRKGSMRACVCVFCFSQKVAEMQSRPWMVFAATPAGARRAGPGWWPILGDDRPRPSCCLSPTESGSRSRKPCGPHQWYRARCASRTSRRPSVRS